MRRFKIGKFDKAYNAHHCTEIGGEFNGLTVWIDISHMTEGIQPEDHILEVQFLVEYLMIAPVNGSIIKDKE